MSLTGKVTNRRSNATNAYDLMSDVKEYILEEPKRVWMDEWIVEGAEQIKGLLGVTGPECGTVGCIAGNVRVLTGNIDRRCSTLNLALGILSDGKEILVDDLYDLFHDTIVDAKYGTKRYARIVAERINKFQREHEADLRAVAVQPTTTKRKAGR